MPLRRTQSATCPALSQVDDDDILSGIDAVKDHHDPSPTSHPLASTTPRREYSFRGIESRGDSSAPDFESGPEVLPYRLQAVGHSLGAACLLMYAVVCQMQGKPHRLRRLILLSPAGFHSRIPLALRPCVPLMPAVTRVMQWLRPGCGMGMRLPSPLLRWVTFKLMADMQHSPALLELFRTGLSMATSGDTSNWNSAIALPHYSVQSMPAISLHTGNHFAQWAKDPAFRLYDFGSAAANREQYGMDVPPSIAEGYRLLSDMPVDLAAGSSDGLIPAENVECHAAALRAAGVTCTLREFSYGHLDFTFGVREEVVSFVLSRLMQSSWGRAGGQG